MSKMACPMCQSNNLKTYATEHGVGNEIQRKKVCLDCGCNFVTSENIRFKIGTMTIPDWLKPKKGK